MATSRLATTAAVISLLAAACAGTGGIHADAPTGSPPSNTSTPSTVVRTCASVAPAGLVGTVLTLPTAGPRQINLGQGVIQCVYGTKFDKPAVLRFYNNADTSFATLEAAAGHGQTITNVRFEDQAFTSASTGGGLRVTELFARKGSVVIAVISSASLRAEETLETRVFANVYHL